MCKKEIENCLKTLKSKKLILYPTDTVWGLGCDATCEACVSKIYALKNRAFSKSLILLVSDLQMLKKYIPEISENVINFIAKTEKPTTVIYSNPVGLAKNAVAEDNTVAIRIPKNDFCIELIKQFGKPLVSTSANISGEPTPNSFTAISEKIIEGVDYVADLYRDLKNDKPSTIVKVKDDGSLEILRP